MPWDVMLEAEEVGDADPTEISLEKASLPLLLRRPFSLLNCP